MRTPEVTYQCQSLSSKTKKRCTRDATHMHAGKNYCSQHHEIHMQMLKDKYAEERHQEKEHA